MCSPMVSENPPLSSAVPGPSVETQPSEMSMSVRDDATGLEYAGALGPAGLFPTARNLGRGAASVIWAYDGWVAVSMIAASIASRARGPG